MKKTSKIINNKAVIYQAASGAIALGADVKRETIWANLNQIAKLFDTDKSGISRHINNILKNDEMDSSTVAFFATVQEEGGRKVSRLKELLVM